MRSGAGRVSRMAARGCLASAALGPPVGPEQRRAAGQAGHQQQAGDRAEQRGKRAQDQSENHKDDWDGRVAHTTGDSARTEEKRKGGRAAYPNPASSRARVKTES